MSLRIQKRFEQLGGKVYTDANVEKVELAGERATGIALAGGQRVEADYIICACDPDYTFRHLLDPSYMDPVFKEVYANRKAYPVYGMFQAPLQSIMRLM